MKGVAWSGENTLYSCGWDAQVCSHIVTGDGNATEGEPTKMEVNGDIVETAATSCVKDSLKLVQKNIVNGDSDTNIAIEQGEETWTFGLNLCPSFVVYCQNMFDIILNKLKSASESSAVYQKVVVDEKFFFYTM